MPKLEKERQGGVAAEKSGQTIKTFSSISEIKSGHFLHFIDEKTGANKVDMCLFFKSEIKIKSVLLFILNHQSNFPSLSENFRKIACWINLTLRK